MSLLFFFFSVTVYWGKCSIAILCYLLLSHTPKHSFSLLHSLISALMITAVVWKPRVANIEIKYLRHTEITICICVGIMFYQNIQFKIKNLILIVRFENAYFHTAKVKIKNSIDKYSRFQYIPIHNFLFLSSNWLTMCKQNLKQKLQTVFDCITSWARSLFSFFPIEIQCSGYFHNGRILPALIFKICQSHALKGWDITDYIWLNECTK